MFKFLRYPIVQDLILVLLCLIAIGCEFKYKTSGEYAIVAILGLQLQINSLERQLKKMQNKIEEITNARFS